MKILIVDDNPDISKPLLSLLTHFGHSCCACSNGKSAMETLVSFVPDLIFLDIWLGDGILFNGIEILKRVRANGFAGKISMYTAMSDETYIDQAMTAGADFYVVKNGEMLAAVQTVITKTAEFLHSQKHVCNTQ